MTREQFIKKWLGNNNFKYCEEHKELMRDDLDKVIERSMTYSDSTSELSKETPKPITNDTLND